MLSRTHLMITLAFVLVILPQLSNNDKIIFIVVALISTYLPDIDSSHSKLGRKIVFRPVQFFFKHRGFFHSFLFLFSLTFILWIFFPKLALGFFVGYASHLLADSLTQEGIYPFHPFNWRLKGFIRTGGKIEFFIFLGFIVLNLFLISRYIFRI